MISLAWAAALAIAAVVVWAVLHTRRARGVVARTRARADRLVAEAQRVAQRAEAESAADFARLPVMAARIGPAGVLARTDGLAERLPFAEPGRSVLEALGDHHIADRVERVLAGADVQEFDAQLFFDRRRRVHVTAIGYLAGDEPRALLLLRDATEAVAYDQLRMQFVANASHELKTPLTGLRGMLEALEDEDLDEALRVRFAGKARAEAERLSSLVDDIMFLSELETGAGELGDEASDLADAAAQVIAALGPTIRGASIEVTLDAPAPAWTSLTERTAGILVGNLVENAARYAGAGARAKVAVAVANGEITLSVADDGVGIADEHLPRIFERFYRVDRARSREVGGTGLGLSIVKHIAERHGGSAAATSRRGFGTTVTVALPAVDPPPEP